VSEPSSSGNAPHSTNWLRTVGYCDAVYLYDCHETLALDAHRLGVFGKRFRASLTTALTPVVSLAVVGAALLADGARTMPGSISLCTSITSLQGLTDQTEEFF
jgi:hypothetical protein